MINLEDFISAETLEPFIAERRLAYEAKAGIFLRQHFSPAVRRLQDADISAVIRLGYDHARLRGIRSEKDLLKYLIPVMYWGSWFETDPQFAPALMRAGWCHPDGTPRPSRNLDALVEEIDIWQAATESDLHHPQRVIDAAVQVHRSAPHPPDIPAAITLMNNAWPARTGLLSPDHQWAFADRCLGAGQRLGLQGADVLCHVILSQYFGWRFADDPRYPWARSAMAIDASDPVRRRLLLEHGILDYWSGLFGEAPCP